MIKQNYKFISLDTLAVTRAQSPHVAITLGHADIEQFHHRESLIGQSCCRGFKLGYMCAKLLQSCPTLCEPMDCSPPDFSVHGVLQARMLAWVLAPLGYVVVPAYGGPRGGAYGSFSLLLISPRAL